MGTEIEDLVAPMIAADRKGRWERGNGNRTSRGQRGSGEDEGSATGSEESRVEATRADGGGGGGGVEERESTDSLGEIHGGDDGERRTGHRRTVNYF